MHFQDPFNQANQNANNRPVKPPSNNGQHMVGISSPTNTG